MSYSALWHRFRFPYRQDQVFAIIFFMVAFVPLVFANYFNDTIELPKLALWVFCFALAILAWLRQQQNTVSFHRTFTIFIAAFVGWALISTLGSLDVVTSIFGLYGRFTGSVLFYGLWGATMVFFLATLTKDKFIFLCKTLVLISTAIAAYGIAQNFDFAHYAGLFDAPRPFIGSFLGNPNFSSMFIASILPLAIFFGLQSRIQASRIYYGTSALVIIIGLALFSSRGSIIAVLVELVIIVGVAIGWRLSRTFAVTMFVGLVITGVVVGSFIPAARPGVVSQTLDLTESNVDTRLAAWDLTLNMIRDNPVLGTGPGNYSITFEQNASTIFSNSERFDDAHNLVLHLAATGGILLAVLFLTIIGFAVLTGWRNFQRTKDPLLLILLAAIVGWLISSCFNPVVVSCWLLLAVLLVGLMLENLRTVTVPKVSLGWRVGLTAGLIVMMLWSVGFVASDALAYQANAAYGNNNWPLMQRFARWSFYTNPTNPTITGYWAYSRIKLGQSPETTEKLVHFLLRLHPRSPRVQSMSGILYYLLYQQTHDQKYLPLMRTALETAVNLSPNQSIIKTSVAYTFNKAGDYDRALYYTRQALVGNPRQFYSWVVLAELYQKMGKYNQVIYALTQVQTLEKSYSHLVNQIIKDLRQQPDPSKVTIPFESPDPRI